MGIVLSIAKNLIEIRCALLVTDAVYNYGPSILGSKICKRRLYSNMTESANNIFDVIEGKG